MLWSSTRQFIDSSLLKHSNIVTTRITSFYNIFKNPAVIQNNSPDRYYFNSNINSWDTSNVTDMSQMFQFVYNFNQPINNWDVSNVRNMARMFRNAVSFNQNLNNWNVSNVTNMTAMFESFNMDQDKFLLSSFNGNISNWDTSNVRDMSLMFKGAIRFNQNINTKTINSGSINEYIAWNTSNVTSMRLMFENMYQSHARHTFNQQINNWDVSNVRNMEGMFRTRKIYNDTSMSKSGLFNRPLSKWNVSNVTNMEEMFMRSKMNQFLRSWNVSDDVNKRQMFKYTPMQNLDIDTYFLGKPVEELIKEGYITFLDAYNQGILNITLKEAVVDYEIVTIDHLININLIEDVFYAIDNNWISFEDAYLEGLLDLKSLTNEELQSTGIYAIELYAKYNFTIQELNDRGYTTDDFLINIDTIPHLNKSFNDYFERYESRKQIILKLNHGLDISKSHLIYVTNDVPNDIFSTDNVVFYIPCNKSELKSGFADLTNQQMISNVRVTGTSVITTLITDMSSIFKDNESFNEEINTWDTSNVTDMSYMFQNAKKFNKNIQNWNTLNVLYMDYMFEGAESFNEPLDINPGNN